MLLNLSKFILMEKGIVKTHFPPRSLSSSIRKKQSFTSVTGKKRTWFQHANKMLPKQKIIDATSWWFSSQGHKGDCWRQRGLFPAPLADVSPCFSASPTAHRGEGADEKASPPGEVYTVVTDLSFLGLGSVLKNSFCCFLCIDPLLIQTRRASQGCSF